MQKNNFSASDIACSAVGVATDTLDVEIVEQPPAVGVPPDPTVFAQKQTGGSQLRFGAISGSQDPTPNLGEFQKFHPHLLLQYISRHQLASQGSV